MRASSNPLKRIARVLCTIAAAVSPASAFLDEAGGLFPGGVERFDVDRSQGTADPTGGSP